MNADNILIIAEMRMSVCCGGLAVSCPACMTDSASALDRFAVVCHLAENLELALCLYYLRLIVTVTNGNSCRVIASVFKLRKSVQQYGGCLMISCKSYDSAHKFYPFHV